MFCFVGASIAPVPLFDFYLLLLNQEVTRWCFNFIADEDGVLNPLAIKEPTGMYRRRGSNPPFLCDPGWVV